MGVKLSQAVIMVGGKGTRLRPLTENRPKPLLPILGVPCVEYIINSLVEAGVEEIILACGYRSEEMVSTIGDGQRFGINIEFSYESEPAGTAGSVKILQDRLHETFIVASGDVLADVDICGMIEIHQANEASMTMALTEVGNPCEFGIVGLDDEGRIQKFKEKPAPEEVFSNLINAGIYVLDKKILDLVPPGVFFDFSKNLFPDLLARGHRLQGHILNGFWKDIGRPSDLLDANLLMAQKSGNLRTGVSSVTDSVISEGCAIMSGCQITGSHIESSVISDNVEIIDSQIISSLILPEAIVDRNSCIINSIIGSGCRIEAASKINNCIIADGQVVLGGSELRDCKLGGYR